VLKQYVVYIKKQCGQGQFKSHKIQSLVRRLVLKHNVKFYVISNVILYGIYIYNVCYLLMVIFYMFSCKLYVGVLCAVYCFAYVPVGYYSCCLSVLCLSNHWWGCESGMCCGVCMLYASYCVFDLISFSNVWRSFKHMREIKILYLDIFNTIIHSMCCVCNLRMHAI
jgi:hypothetical protein